MRCEVGYGVWSGAETRWASMKPLCSKLLGKVIIWMWLVNNQVYKPKTCGNYGFFLFRSDSTTSTSNHTCKYVFRNERTLPNVCCALGLGGTDRDGWSGVMICDKMVIAGLLRLWKWLFSVLLNSHKYSALRVLFYAVHQHFLTFFQTIGLYSTRETICLITHWLSSPLIYILSYFNYAIHCILNVDKLLKIQRL